MVIITNPNITQAQLDHIREQVEARGMSTRITRGERQTIIGCIGDDDILREMALHRLPGVQSVVPVMKPYKLASRQFTACPTEVRVAIAAGADGLIIEVHPTPETALSDGDQSLTLDSFSDLMSRIGSFAEAAGRSAPMTIGSGVQS